MKKFLSTLSTLLLLALFGVAGYFNQAFVIRQINKVQGVYYVYLGDKAYKKNNLLDAIKLYNKAVALYPGHYSAWYNLGNIYVEYEDYPSSVYAYSQAFKHNPKMMIARMNYGIIEAEKLGNFDEAIQQYDKITNTNRFLITIPYIYDNKVSTVANKAIAYYNKGVTYRLKAMYSNKDAITTSLYMSKAIEAYKKSIEINPKSFDTQFNLGIAYYIVGNYQESGECYCSAIKLDPMSFEAHYNMAVLLRKMGYYKSSYDEIEKAMNIISTSKIGNDLVQQYISLIYNTISVEYYHSSEYADLLSAEKNASLPEKLSKKQLKQLKKDKDYKKEIKEIEESEKKASKNKAPDFSNPSMLGLNLLMGSLDKPEELDEAVKEVYGSCPIEITAKH